MFLQRFMKPFCRDGWLARFIAIGVVGMVGMTSAPAFAISVGAIVPTDGASDADVEDLYEEDLEAAEERRGAAKKGCQTPGFCFFLHPDPLFTAEGDDLVRIVFCADAPCNPLTFNIQVFLQGNLVIDVNFEDFGAPRCFFFNVIGLESLPPGFSFPVEIVIRDNMNNQSSACLLTVEICAAPACYFDGVEIDEERDGHPMIVFDVETGDTLPVYEVCARSNCGGRARVEMFARPPFLDPIGHRKGGLGEKVCISTRANDVVEGGYAEGTYWAKFRCTDLLTGGSRVLKVGYRYTDPPEPEPEPCDVDPVCEILEGGSMTVNVDETGSFTLCVESGCEGCPVEFDDGIILPDYVVPGGCDGEGDAFCCTFSVMPDAGDVGSVTLTFIATDCEGNETRCSIEINVPAPLLACTENEDRLPNDSFADASVIDAGECADAFGVNIYGVLETVIFINGDVDYFRVVGLTPGEVYDATIVAGLNSANEFTDTMLGWLAADGVIVAMDDNSGPLTGYSKITFTADEDGVATLAITGHGDGDFNGLMDASMPYEEYGFGGYMLSIRAVDGNTMPIEIQADLNGDGVVNTADLGILIGLFGVTN